MCTPIRSKKDVQFDLCLAYMVLYQLPYFRQMHQYNIAQPFPILHQHMLYLHFDTAIGFWPFRGSQCEYSNFVRTVSVWLFLLPMFPCQMHCHNHPSTRESAHDCIPQALLILLHTFVQQLFYIFFFIYNLSDGKYFYIVHLKPPDIFSSSARYLHFTKYYLYFNPFFYKNRPLCHLRYKNFSSVSLLGNFSQ